MKKLAIGHKANKSNLFSQGGKETGRNANSELLLNGFN